MKIARDLNGIPIECTSTTPNDATYHCFMCGAEVYPCNEKKLEDGRKKGYYFAHHTDACPGNIESYFHQIAKIIIKGSTEINLPDKKMKYTHAEVECTSLHPGLRPDVVLDNVMVIEICYSNPKTPGHIKLFEEVKLSAIEICIDNLDLNSTLDEIRYAVLEDNQNRKYLYKVPSPMHSMLSLALLAMAVIGAESFLEWIFKGHRKRT